MKTDTNNDKPKVVFIPYELDIENVKTVGNYQQKDSSGEIKTTYALPFNEDVTEINVDPPSDKMFWSQPPTNEFAGLS